MIKKIEDIYQRKNYGQVMFPFKKHLTIIGEKGIMTHIHDNSEFNEVSKKHINEYVLDDRRFDFPYAMTPIHCLKTGLFKSIKYANMILELEKLYIVINDKTITEEHIIKSEDGMSLCSTTIYKETLFNSDESTSHITHAELQQLFEPESKKFIVLSDGCICDKNIIGYTANEQFDTAINGLTIRLNRLLFSSKLSAQDKENLKSDIDDIQQGSFKNIDMTTPIFKDLMIVYIKEGIITITINNIFFVSYDEYKAITKSYVVSIDNPTPELEKNTEIIPEPHTDHIGFLKNVIKKNKIRQRILDQE